MVTGFAKNIETFQEDKILVETACEKNEKCNTDQRAYKGLTARALSHAAQAAPFVSEMITPVIEASAKAAVEACGDKKTGVECSLGWASKKSKSVGVGESFSALSVVQALLPNNPTGNGTSGNGTSGNGTSGNGTSGNGTQTQPANGSPSDKGENKTEEHTGAASALMASGNFIVPLVALSVVLL